MKGLRLSMTFAALAALSGSVLGVAPDITGTDPEILLHSTVDELLDAAYPAQPRAALPDLSERALPILDKAFDFAAITRRAIGPGWRQFSETDRQRSIRDFRKLLVQSYASRIRGEERPRITYGILANRSEDRCEIPTQVLYEGETYAVAYRMERRAGAWRVTDVVIEGVSFVSNYREQFDGIMQRGGSTAVIEAIEGQLARKAAGKP